MLRAMIEFFILIETKKKRAGVLDNKKFVTSVKKNNRIHTIYL
jgi:hypothetical protein